MCNQRNPRKSRGWTAMVTLALTLLVWSDLGAQSPGAMDGIVRFEADHSVIALPPAADAIIFDTSTIDTEVYSTFQLIGELIIDSITTAGKTRDATDAYQTDGLAINSPTLLSLFKRHNVYALKKSFPGSIPHDTLIYNPIRDSWIVVPDISRSYEIVFHDSIDVTLVFNDLKELTDVGGVELRPEILLFDTPLGDPWIPDDPMFADHQWSLQPPPGVNAAQAWGYMSTIPRGKVPIAIIDDGVDTVQNDVAPKKIGGEDSIYGPHGTLVAGVALAVTNNGICGAGAAPDGELLAYNMFVTPPWADIESARLAGAQVINMSWGTLFDVTDLSDACERAYAQGVILIAAAGNDYGATFPFSCWPALYNDWVIAVGAYDTSDYVTAWSNYGCLDCDPPVPHFVDVIAPGTQMTTPGPFNLCHPDYFSGTSFSAPLVSGIVALAKGYESNLHMERIQTALRETSRLNYSEDTLKYGAGRLDAAAFVREFLNTATASPVDSVPCIIITRLENCDPLRRLRDTKTRRGTPTQIINLNAIEDTYSGKDTPEKIRNCIKDYYHNKYLEYVILAGDESDVPCRYAHQDIEGPGVDFVSDWYFACLDGDWDADRDGIFGEIEDDVDLIPEVAVGRLPFSDPVQFTDFVNKLFTYETGTDLSWSTKALFLGSQMFQYGDGPAMSEHLRTLFPPEFTATTLYDDASGSASDAAYFSQMNSGQGIVVVNCLAQSEGDFCIRQSEDPQYIDNSQVDTLSNHGMPSVVFSATCWNHQLDHDCIAKHYMRHPTGGAVAYIGSSYRDFIYRSHDIGVEFFGQLFGDGPKEIGALLNTAKSAIEPGAHRDGSTRHSILGYTLSGDPQLRVWTTLPRRLQQDHALSISSGVNATVTNYVSDAATGEQIAGATVCLRKVDDEYQIGITDSSGRVDFPLTFHTVGEATITAGKEGFVYDTDTIFVTDTASQGPPPSCPVLFVFDGRKFVMENPLLTACEQTGYEEVVTDYYPITQDISPTESLVRFQLREMEHEVTYLEKLELITVDHDASTKICCTPEGKILALHDTPIEPISVVNRDGNDCLSSVRAADGNWFAADESGELTVTFPEIDVASVITLSASSKRQCPDLLSSVGADDLAENKATLLVSVLGDDGIWRQTSPVASRTYAGETVVSTDLLRASNSGPVTVRIQWDGPYATDAIRLYTVSESNIGGKHCPVDRTSLTRFSSATVMNPRFNSADPLVLRKGDVYEISFRQDATPSASLVRDYVICATGRYEPAYAVNSNLLPDRFELANNYPNPFNPDTRIDFALPRACRVTLEIFNVVGQRVTTLVDREMTAGYHTVVWNGGGVASGVYLYRLRAGDFERTKKMILVK